MKFFFFTVLFFHVSFSFSQSKKTQILEYQKQLIGLNREVDSLKLAYDLKIRDYEALMLQEKTQNSILINEIKSKASIENIICNQKVSELDSIIVALIKQEKKNLLEIENLKLDDLGKQDDLKLCQQNIKKLQSIIDSISNNVIQKRMLMSGANIVFIENGNLYIYNVSNEEVRPLRLSKKVIAVCSYQNIIYFSELQEKSLDVYKIVLSIGDIYADKIVSIEKKTDDYSEFLGNHSQGGYLVFRNNKLLVGHDLTLGDGIAGDYWDKTFQVDIENGEYFEKNMEFNDWGSIDNYYLQAMNRYPDDYSHKKDDFFEKKVLNEIELFRKIPNGKSIQLSRFQKKTGDDKPCKMEDGEHIVFNELPNGKVIYRRLFGCEYEAYPFYYIVNFDGLHHVELGCIRDDWMYDNKSQKVVFWGSDIKGESGFFSCSSTSNEIKLLLKIGDSVSQSQFCYLFFD